MVLWNSFTGFTILLLFQTWLYINILWTIFNKQVKQRFFFGKWLVATNLTLLRVPSPQSPKRRASVAYSRNCWSTFPAEQKFPDQMSTNFAAGSIWAAEKMSAGGQVGSCNSGHGDCPLVYLTITWGAAARTASVAMMVNKVNVIRQSRSRTWGEKMKLG